MELKFFALLTVTLAFVLSAEGNQCIVGREVLEGTNVTLSNCQRIPCSLRRRTSVSVEVKFTPEKDITSLKNAVNADILGVPFPFIGVDGNSICDKVFDAKSGAKVDCPLHKGAEYVYKDQFNVLEVYPRIRVVVNWALRDQDNQTVACFQVPARIV